MDNQIIKGMGKGLEELSKETMKTAVEETGKIFESVISGKELLGDISPMTDTEMVQKQAEDEKKKQEEIAKLKAEMGPGRKVEEELEELRREKEKEEKEREKAEYEEEKQKQEETAALEAEEELLLPSSNPAKQKKSRGSAFVNKKKQQPDTSQMSQTTEFKGKID